MTIQLKRKNFSFDKSKESICFVIASGLSFRNIMLDSSLKNLLGLQDKFNIVFITEQKYIRTYKTKINFIQIKKISNKYVLLINKIINFLSRALFDKLNHTTTKKILYRTPFHGNFYTKFFSKYHFIIPKSVFLYKSLRKINDLLLLYYSPDIKDELLKLNPVHIISTDPISKIEYPYLLIGNKFYNSSAIIKSFDNITTNGYIPFVPRNIFVWNNQMYKEAKTAYSLYNPNVFAIGAPQYDHVKSSLKKLNENSNQILYCSTKETIYRDDLENITFLQKFAKKNNFIIKLRIHQGDDSKRFLQFRKFDNIEIYPDDLRINDINELCSDCNHQESLAKQIRSSFVVISSISTILFDSLSMGVPTINLGFDVKEINKKWSIKRTFNFDHLKPLLNLNCVDNVNSQRELKEKIIQRYKYGFKEKEEQSRLDFLENFLGPNCKYDSMQKLLMDLNL